MAHYLVVAHQTATEPHLIERLRGLAADGPGSKFTLLVPATRVEHLATWARGESEEVARRRGDEAASAFRAAGLRVENVLVGDELPIWAIEDELRAHPDAYEAIVISTLPPGRSRWVEMYTHTRAERRFGLPVIHVYEGIERAWPDGRPPSREPRPSLVERALDWLTGPEGEPGVRVRRGYVALFALMVLYILGASTLAIVVNRGFLVTEAFAMSVFALLLGALLLIERRRGML